MEGAGIRMDRVLRLLEVESVPDWSRLAAAEERRRTALRSPRIGEESALAIGGALINKQALLTWHGYPRVSKILVLAERRRAGWLAG